MSDFVIWTLLAFGTAAVIYYVTATAYSVATFSGGMTDGVWSMGHTCTFALVVTHHGLVAVMTKNYTWFLLGTYCLSFMLFFPLSSFINEFAAGGAYTKGAPIAHMIFNEIMREPQFWLCLILTASVSILMVYGFKSVEYLIRNPQYREDEQAVKNAETC